jgi:NAD(P)-dependent dehydrogenase (short-subunit alcohol dehydrogenase family)
MIEVNLRSAFYAVRAASPPMAEAGYGRIVLVSSRAARTVPEGQAAYAVAKGGVITLVEAAGMELRHQGVTVNCVLPSVIDTAANRHAMQGADPSKWVRPEELAAVILFLASEEASAVSGAAVPVYGRA